MFKQLSSVGTIYENYMIKRGRTEAHKILLAQDDKTLFDIGIDRHELIGGVKNWPWDGSASKQKQAAKKSTFQFKAIRELSNYTDRELHDIGINRGMIADAVKNGRPGLDNQPAPTRPSESGDERKAA